jgi:FMN phosphatase YigB (HAD superfamily)
VTLRAAFFDVGDTLVEHWAPPEVQHAKARARLCAAFGERDWYDEWIRADIEPEPIDPGKNWVYQPDLARQETNAWYEKWFREKGIDLDGIDIDRFRSAMCVPLDELSVPAPGAFDAVRWCGEKGLKVLLVSNTLSRGDEEILEDWRRFGLGDAIDGAVSSHSTGWRKPHPAIFARALEIAGVRPAEAFHVGDDLIADIWGAKQVGLRAVWRKTSRAQGASGIDVDPDRTIDDLTELPAIARRWMA